MALAKYRTPEHRARVKAARATVDAGDGWCDEIICLEEHDGRSRWIPPGTPVHVLHEPDGHTYRGIGHPRCNSSESVTRTNHRRTPSRRWVI